MAATKHLKRGDWVIYRKQKESAAPGPRARQLNPAGMGETYSYLVDKFWVVQEILGDDQIRLLTRRGKQHLVSLHDPRLRRANLFERLIHRGRFLETAQQLDSPGVAASE